MFFLQSRQVAFTLPSVTTLSDRLAALGLGWWLWGQIGIESSKERAFEAFEAFNHLSADLGLVLAPKKCSSPDRSIIWLGFKIDTPSMTVTILEEKL